MEIIIVGKHNNGGDLLQLIQHFVASYQKTPKVPAAKLVVEIARLSLAHGFRRIRERPLSLNVITQLKDARVRLSADGNPSNQELLEFIGKLLFVEERIASKTSDELVNPILWLFYATPQSVIVNWQESFKGFLQADGAMSLLTWYSEKYLPVTLVIGNLYFSTRVHDDSILRTLQQTLSAGRLFAEYFPSALADYRTAQPWTPQGWLRIREDELQVSYSWLRLLGERMISRLVPADPPALTSAPNTHTASTLLTVIHQKLLLGDGLSEDKRPPIKITTSFRPCLGCALLAGGYSRVSPKLIGSKVTFFFPFPDVKDASPWYMPKVEDDEHRKLLVEAFDKDCNLQIKFWALTKEYAADERMVRAARRSERGVKKHSKNSGEETIDTSLAEDAESDDEYAGDYDDSSSDEWP